MTKTFAELGFEGRLIAVEGLDGSGKSTQIYLLKRWLEMRGFKVFFSEWNSSALVKSATSKGKKQNLLTPTTFSLIHATDFADRYERQLLPLLKAGTWCSATGTSLRPSPETSFADAPKPGYVAFTASPRCRISPSSSARISKSRSTASWIIDPLLSTTRPAWT
jgi:hypothetical protein